MFSNVVIKVHRYATLLKNKNVPNLQARQCLSRRIFMQDAGPPYTSRCVMNVLKTHFTEHRVISRHFTDPWISRSLNFVL